MLAKMTVKNQLTLPKEVLRNFGGVEYFEVSTDGESITLSPLQTSRASAVRAQLEDLGIGEGEVQKAVLWAREQA